MSNLTLPVKLLTETAQVPTRGSVHSAGLDLYLDLGKEGSVVYMYPNVPTMLKTNISVEIPEGYYGQIAPRSGLAVKKGIQVLAGIIDSDYRGDIRVALIHNGAGTIGLEHGERIAQLILIPCLITNTAEVTTMSDTDRGEGGFGSTGA